MAREIALLGLLVRYHLGEIRLAWKGTGIPRGIRTRFRVDSPRGVLPPLSDCEVNCEADPAYGNRQDTNAGKPILRFPRLFPAIYNTCYGFHPLSTCLKIPWQQCRAGSTPSSDTIFSSQLLAPRPSTVFSGFIPPPSRHPAIRKSSEPDRGRYLLT